MEEKFNILVADDEPEVLAMLGNLVQALGREYNVFLSANGFEALKILKQTPIDFAFLDQHMAEISGLELLEKIRQRYQNVQVVLITGQPSYSLVLEAWRHQASDFLLKPVRLADLKAVIEKLKSQKSSRTQTLTLIHSGPGTELIENLHGQIDRLTREQHILIETFTSLGQVRQTEELYTKILEMALNLTDARQAHFLLFDQEHQRLEPIVSLGNGELTPAFREAAQQVAGDHNPVFIQGRSNNYQGREMGRIGLALPLRVRGELFGVLVVSHKVNRNFDSDDMLMLNLLAERSSLAIENMALYESAFSNHYETLRALVNSLEARDPYSYHHSERVTQLALRFAQELKLPPDQQDAIQVAGLLHDIGKVGIRDAILLKPGKLTPEERSIIQTHPLVGERIVEPLGLLPIEKAIILYHHERWDGCGYPCQLAGKEIPLLSRIVALADTYDALTSNRPYRDPWPHKDALTEILANAGSQFDPELTRIFVQIMEKPFPTPKSPHTQTPKDFSRRSMRD
ncbi:MAG: response regulator [Deltaproteobacteria bacterium]|nr:response regulator [Deltaproteobacteria bacterium]